MKRSFKAVNPAAVPLWRDLWGSTCRPIFCDYAMPTDNFQFKREGCPVIEKNKIFFDGITGLTGFSGWNAFYLILSCNPVEAFYSGWSGLGVYT
jgi:hypothetical protein